MAGWIRFTSGAIYSSNAIMGREGQDFNFYDSNARFYAIDPEAGGMAVNQIYSNTDSVQGKWDYWAITRDAYDILKTSGKYFSDRLELAKTY